MDEVGWLSLFLWLKFQNMMIIKSGYLRFLLKVCYVFNQSTFGFESQGMARTKMEGQLLYDLGQGSENK